MKTFLRKSYPQPQGVSSRVPPHLAAATESDSKSTLTLVSIAAASVFLVAGVMYFQGGDSAEPMQVAQNTPSDEPRADAPVTRDVAATRDLPIAPAPQPLVPTQTLPTEIVPERLRAADLPRHTVRETPPAPVVAEVQEPEVPQPTQPEAPAAAEINAAAPLVALVDEETGNVKNLAPQDMQLIATLLSEKSRAAQSAEAVTRLETAPLASVAPEPVTEANCVDELRTLAENSTIYFLSGGTQLSPRDIVKIRAIGTATLACPDAIVQVSGHSDASGDEQANIAISWERADNTIAALEGMGFDTSRMDPVGFGARLPVAEGDGAPEMDRRVEFLVMEKR